MKTVTTAFNTHLDGETTSLASCIKLTLTKFQPRIVAVSNANPGVIETRWAHGFETGDVVKIVETRGMVELNRNEYTVTRIDDLHFSIGVDTTLYTPYSHKGEARKVIGYTSYQDDVVFDGVTYSSKLLAYTPDSMKQGSDMSVDSVEHRGLLVNAVKNFLNGVDVEGVVDEDIIAGKYEGAKVEVFVVNYENLSMGRMNLPISGTLGEFTMRRGIYEAEHSGKAAILQETRIKAYTTHCRADLGDRYDGSEPEHELQQGFGCKVRLFPPAWRAETEYAVRPPHDAGLGGVVRPSVYNGFQFRASVGGLSGLTEPVWNTTLGGTTADGAVTWVTEAALTKRGLVHAVIDRRRFIDNDRDEAPIAGAGGMSTLFPITAVSTGSKRFTIAGNFADQFPVNARFTVVNSTENDGEYSINSSANAGLNTNIFVGQDIPVGTVSGAIVGRLPELVGHFTHGLLTFITGKNKGVAREVRTFSATTVDGVTFTGPGYFELFEAFPFDMQQGDEYEVTAGCDKSLAMCIVKFDNVYNRRAEDNIPGPDAALLYPDAK